MVAMLVTPAATGYLLTRRLPVMILAAAIVLTATLFFLLAFVWKRLKVR
jgi:ABC-type Mn2+/Zn2+ transport system permease subunit